MAGIPYLLGLDISLLRKTRLWNNPNISYSIADGTLKKWTNKGIQTVEDLYSDNIFSNFQQIHYHSLFLSNSIYNKTSTWNSFKSDIGSKLIQQIFQIFLIILLSRSICWIHNSLPQKGWYIQYITFQTKTYQFMMKCHLKKSGRQI